MLSSNYIYYLYCKNNLTILHHLINNGIYSNYVNVSYFAKLKVINILLKIKESLPVSYSR